MNFEQAGECFFLLMYKNIRNVSLCVCNKMADIKEEKTRFDIYFSFGVLFHFRRLLDKKCVSFISLFCDAFGWNSIFEKLRVASESFFGYLLPFYSVEIIS